jgi:hypothetical protein
MLRCLFFLFVIASVSFCTAQKTDEVGRGRISIRPVVIPAPTLTFPENNMAVSAGPAFRVSVTLSPAETVTYDVEIARAGFSRIVSSAAVTSGTSVDISVPYDNGLQPGTYTWRARARTSLETGTWSATRTIRVNGGIDLVGSLTVAQFQAFKADGWDSHFAAGWGGRSRWSTARQNLINAAQAGMKVGAYCLLNFDNGSTISGAPANQTGQWQVDQAFTAVGYNFTTGKSSLPYDLKYMVVDVETFWGTMTAAQRVQRVAEAVQRIRDLGFWPMIYARNEGVALWWRDYMGSSTDFGDLPLWNTSPELTTSIRRDNLMIVKGAVYVPYGGWTVPTGKQFLLDTTVSGIGIDLNTWEPGTWEVTSPNPGSAIVSTTPTLTRINASTIEVAISVINTGTVPAHAVRITDVSLGNATSTSTLSLQSVPNAGQRIARLNMVNPGSPGTRRILKYTVWTGYGPTTVEQLVVLPR